MLKVSGPVRIILIFLAMLFTSPGIYAEESKALKARRAYLRRQRLKEPKNWTCTATVFTEKFSATGPSRAEAKMRLTSACTKKYTDGQCSSATCEKLFKDEAIAETKTDEKPDENQKNKIGWVCTLKPFAKTYSAAAAKKADAEKKAIQSCKKNESETFCASPTCQEG